MGGEGQIHYMSRNPIIAISVGDPAGISPEIVVSALEKATDECRPIVFGHWPSFARALDNSDGTVKVELASESRVPQKGSVTFVHCGPDGQPCDHPDKRSASAQFSALERAVDVVIDGTCEALVTAPVAKKSVAQISPGFLGHTEYLAGRAGIADDDVTMVFAGESLSVGLVSTHVPLREASEALTLPRLERTTRHVVDIVEQLQPGSVPRIGVAAINPHAGEGGLLGDEEDRLIAPFCKSFAAQHEVDIWGPVPADVLFRDALDGKMDGIVATYHDQAMIPLKLAGIGQTVNVTMGLPFVRTSPDHGVAYDIARKGIADPAGMISAVSLAIKMVGLD
jgi:4-hydroxythreonine-4-phosphate dehydrogenase